NPSAGPLAHRYVEVHRREVLDQEKGGEDDEACGERRTEPAVVADVDVQEADQDRDASSGEDQVDHPKCPKRHAITVRRGAAPYLLFPQSRLDAPPDFQEVFEVDLQPG